MVTVESSKMIKGNRLKFIYEEEIAKNESKTEVGQKKLIMNGIIITIAISSATLAVVFIIILVFKIKNLKKNGNKENEKKENNNTSVENEDKHAEKTVVKNQEIETLDKDEKNTK